MKVLNKIGIILLIITIIIFNFIIGANEKGLRILPISILMALNIIYLIITKIINKKQNIVFKTKVDYLVLAFMLTTTLPLIFKTYASYSDTVEFIMKYFYIYSVYILARNVITEKKQVEIIIVTTLICSLIPIILEFDYLHGKMLEGFMKWLRIIYYPSHEFVGTFGYGNTQAIYMALCVLLAMHRFKTNKNKILKAIDIIYILFSFYIIWTTESKAIMILLGITLLSICIAKYRKQIVKHKIKIIIVVIILLSLLTGFLVMALNTSKSVTKNNEDLDQIIKYNFKQNVKYTLELELVTHYIGTSNSEKKNAFELQILQGGKYFFETVIAKDTLENVEGNYKIEFTPTKDITYIRLKIVNKYKGIIIINRCYINGTEHIINYKYIPNEIGYIFSGFLVNGKSLRQRKYMYLDSLKIAKDSPIIGSGGDAWKNLSCSVADYTIRYKECHSYFFELLISYGIVGVIAYLALVIYLFIKIFKQCKQDKEKRKDKLVIALGLFILLLHSITFDFNMSFMVIQILVYIYMAILLYDEQENVKSPKLSDIAVIIILVLILSIYIRADISKYLINDNSTKHSVTPYQKEYSYNALIDKMKNEEYNIETLNELKKLIDKEPYYNQTESQHMYFDLINKNLDNISNEDLQKYMDFIIERLETVRFKTPMFIETLIYRTTTLANAIKDFEKYTTNEKADKGKIEILNNTIEKLKDIINKEYETNIKNIEDYERNGYTESARNLIKSKYNEIINSIK